MWRSSWWLRSCGTTTRSRSSSPSRLLRPAQTTLLKSTKEEPLPSSLVALVLRDVLDSIQSTPVIPEGDGSSVEEAVASGHFEETVLEDAPI
ncbi:hypothetical protein Taro_033369 [Colocasia esculenta]|uniref:Uncharacterized protein n=1 Tax=Colocasia esculenta TaxID=4460 RepID=A0A843W4K0_COLES|nr:hypothetical protein [Colocasia esculenta]